MAEEYTGPAFTLSNDFSGMEIICKYGTNCESSQKGKSPNCYTNDLDSRCGDAPLSDIEKAVAGEPD